MRVIQLAPTAFGADGLHGGGERYPLELARALARRIDCRLVTFGPEARSFRDPSGLEISVVRTVFKLKGHPAHPVGRFREALDGAEMIHAHQMRATPVRLAAVVAALRRLPIAVTDHGLGPGGWGGLLPRLFDLFLCVSEESARSLRAPPQKTRVIYGGCDPQRFTPDPNGVREGILFVGRLTPHKGIDRLLRALPEGARLTIAGTGGHDPSGRERGYVDLLHALARDKDVNFVDAPGDDELVALYRSARVFVLPSVTRTCYGRDVAISELLGLAAIEAMSSGTPVICSRVGGLPEVVAHGETGYLVEPGDTDELRDRIRELLSDPQRAAKMGSAAREVVVQRFTWDACAARCLTAYEELIGAM